MWVVKGFWCWSFHLPPYSWGPPQVQDHVAALAGVFLPHWRPSSTPSRGPLSSTTPSRPPCPTSACSQQVHLEGRRPSLASLPEAPPWPLWAQRTSIVNLYIWRASAVVDKDFSVTETSPWCDHNDWKMLPDCLISRLAQVWKWTEALVNWLEQRGRQAPPLLLYKHQVQVHMFTSTEVHKYNQAPLHCQRQVHAVHCHGTLFTKSTLRRQTTGPTSATTH